MLESVKDDPDALDDLDLRTLPIEEAFKSHGLSLAAFTDWLNRRGKSFLEADRRLLQGFNYMMAQELNLHGKCAVTVSCIWAHYFSRRSQPDAAIV